MAKKDKGCLRCNGPTNIGKYYCSQYCWYNRRGTTTIERFWFSVRKTKKCWLWKTGTSYKGYGVFLQNSKHISAHKFSYQEFVGPVPKGLHVLHTCDVRNCVNPKHLYLGTNQDNVNDRVIRGRQTAKVSLKQAEQIRILYAKGNITQAALGMMFGVDRSNIHYIVRRKTRTGEMK